MNSFKPLLSRLTPLWVLVVFHLTYLVHAQELAAPEANQGPEAEEVLQIKLDVPAGYLVFSEPRREDGTVDYIAAFNAKYSEGVTKENNAFRDLYVLFDQLEEQPWQDHEWQVNQVEQIAKILELELDTIRQGPHFVSLDEYFESIGFAGDELDAFWDRFDKNPLKAMREDHAQAWLKQAKPVLERSVKAVQKPRYWSPMAPADEAESLVAVMLPNLSNYRSLARSMQYWSYDLIAQGEYDKALQVIVAVRKLAAHIATQPTLIQNLVGISIDAITLDMVKNLIAIQALPDKQLAALDKLLRKRPERTPMVEAVRYGESAMGIDAYVQILTGRMGANGIMGDMSAKQLQKLMAGGAFDVNRGVRQLSVQYKQLVRVMAIKDFPTCKRMLDMLDQQMEEQMLAQQKKFFFMVGEAKIPNPVALSSKEARTDAYTAMFTSIMMPALGAASRTEYRSLATEQCIYTAIAIERYRLKSGRLPQALTDLVPAYLQNLPLDLFSEKPVLYQKTDSGFKVYTVGINQVDDGGRLDQSTDDRDWGIEIVWPNAE